ncbi:MAG: FG-GAP repeat protein [Candidatus Eisenbacteria bacterium]|nr:FG-GAP repeat protein [Candidatus Eisenbacteria bacterium]
MISSTDTTRPLRAALRVAGAISLALALAAPAFSAETPPTELVMPKLWEPDRSAQAFPGLAEVMSGEGSGANLTATRMGALAAGLKPPAQPSLVGTTPGWAYESNVASRYLGSYAHPLGDLNGDGYGDFAATGNVNSFNTALYVFLGSASGPALQPGFPVTTLPADAAICPAGDVNGDGFADMAMFWPNNGNLRLYFGSAAGLSMSGFNTLNAHFPALSLGMSGGPAGDVNGDGYGDVIFGMPNYGSMFPCGPATGAGLVEVMYGSATGLTASSNWYGPGCFSVGSGAGLGTSVAGAGDVNADGYDDIIAGAPGADLQFVGVVGKAYIVYGSASGLPLINGFSNVGSISSGTTIAGQHLFGTFGNSVAAAGDVNGDGYADVAVGSPYDDNYGTDSGLASIFRGTSAGVDTATANRLWWDSSGVPGAMFGVSLDPAGDVNGDSHPDLLIGETSRWDLLQSAGSVMLIQQTLARPSTYATARTAGDVNGDGLSDVLVGDTYWTNGENLEGRVSVHYGAGGAPSTFANWSVTQSAIDNPNLGWSVAGGDVNGDGYEDVIVGCPTWYDFTTGGSYNNGLLMVFYGHVTGLSASYDWFYFGANGDQTGLSVATADVNGDGYADILASAHTAAGNSGLVRVWFGSSSGPSVSGPNQTLTAPAPGGYFGASVAAAGDVNNDGYPDVVVGAPNAEDPVTPISDQGVAYVYLGGAGGVVTPPVWSRAGGQVNSHLGQSVAGAGDVNGDGYADVVIGEPDFDSVDRLGNPYPDAGRVHIAYGSAGGPSGSYFMNTFASWRFGASVAGAGDVNGDGYSDIIVGGPSATNTLPGEGVARVFAGGPFGLGGLLWSQFGGEANGGFGSAVSSAGDVDGDGLSDVLVGAVFQDMGGPQDQGRAYVYRGPLPAGASPVWTASGGSTFANLGHSLANAGDVNGDGWSDLVFGLPGYNGTGYRQGIARTYYGCGYGGAFQIGRAYRFTAPAHQMQPSTMSDPGGVYLLSTGRSSAGRAKVRLQYRVDPVVGLPGGATAGFTGWYATGAPGAYGSLAGMIAGAGGLTAGVPYAWRMRTLSNNIYYPTGPWRSPERSGRRETDFRTPGTFLDVADGRRPAELLLADVRPNPMRTSTSVVFSLSKPGPVSLSVHDVMGRRVRVLSRGDLGAGEHRIAWDGAGDDGRAVSAGIYIVRLEAEGRALSRKVVRMK